MLIIVHEAGTGISQAVAAKSIEDCFFPSHPAVSSRMPRDPGYELGGVLFWKTGPKHGHLIEETPEQVAKKVKEAMAEKADPNLLDFLHAIQAELQMIKIAAQILSEKS